MHAPAHRSTRGLALLAVLAALLTAPAVGSAQPATPASSPASQEHWCVGGSPLSPAVLESVQRNLRFRRGGDPAASLWTGATRFASADMAEGYLGGLGGQDPDYAFLMQEVLPYLSLAGADGLEAEFDFEGLHPLWDELVRIGDGTAAQALTVTVKNGDHQVDFALAQLAVRFDDVVLEYVARARVEPAADPEAAAPPTALLLELETMARYFGKRTPGGPVVATPLGADCAGGLWDLLPASSDLPDGCTATWGRFGAAGEG